MLEASPRAESFRVEVMEDFTDEIEKEVVQVSLNGEKLEGRRKSSQSLKHTHVEKNAPLSKCAPFKDGDAVKDPKTLIST